VSREPRLEASEPSRIERAAVDDRTIADIAAGNLSGLGLLFDRYAEDVRRLLSRLGVPPSDLDDAVQQTFLDVPRASVRFHAGAPVRPWLFGLATIVARRRRRALTRMLARLHAWAREPAPAPAESAHVEYELKVEARRAEDALQSISGKKREAFVLVVLEGMSGAEAADVLGVPVATIWTRIHHARLELRERLEKERG
jgi:RNA polymerase sigma factor (sigma-70 family)